MLLGLVSWGSPMPALAVATQQVKPRKEVTMPAVVARAVAVAQYEFHKSGFTEASYDVLVNLHDDAFEVIYVPEQSGGRGSVRGGETPASKEIHYWVDRKDFRLQRTVPSR